jgi:hydroxymethylglutaryl-CoA lyase
MQQVRLIECPRDAMQGWTHFIPTEKKAAYLNALLKVGFDVIDFGSFVSPKAIPQMADTATVLGMLDLSSSRSKLLAIVANERGAREAAAFPEISYLGYPFSISETFQKRNTNAGISESFDLLLRLMEICLHSGKELVVYISMGFGNPYGDPYDAPLVLEWVEKIKSTGVKIISIADTVGIATASQVGEVLDAVIAASGEVEIGAHLHSTAQNRADKLKAAWEAGCRRFDSAMNGIGGCPMAGNELVGNMETQFMIRYFRQQGLVFEIDDNELLHCSSMASEIFI